MNNRDFKGVWIPKEIWLNTDLSLVEKCLLVEIDSLDNGEKGCFKSNENLGKFIGKSAGRTANIISDLRKRKFIVDVFNDGYSRGIRLHENVKGYSQKRESNLHENVKGVSRKREHSNTVSNTVSNTNKEKVYKKTYGELDNVLLSEEQLSKLKEKFPDYYARIDRLSLYIAQSGKKYKNHYATILAWYARENKGKPDSIREVKFDNNKLGVRDDSLPF